MKKDFLTISDNKGTVRIPCNEIIRLEARKNYTVIHRTKSRQHICSKNIGAVEQQHLAEKNNFVKVHKSHIININNMERYKKEDGGVAIMNDNSIVPVAKKRKAVFNRTLKKH